MTLPGEQDRPAITVVVVDDQQIVLAGVAAVISTQPDLRVVGTAGDLQTAVELIARVQPDVVLSDIQLGDQSGLELLDYFPHARPPIIMLSAFEHATYYQVAFERGAAGFVLKAALVEQLTDALRTVAGGGLAFAAHALHVRRGAVKTPSRRELGVIQLVAQGSSNDEIAQQLAISAKTVDSHLRVLFDRYGAVSRTELAMRAVREGWLRTTATSAPRAQHGPRDWMIDEKIVRTR